MTDSQAVPDLYESTVLADTDVLISIGRIRLNEKGVVGGGYGKNHLKSIAVYQLFYGFEISNWLIRL